MKMTIKIISILLFLSIGTAFAEKTTFAEKEDSPYFLVMTALKENDAAAALAIIDDHPGFLNKAYDGFYPIHWTAIDGNISLLDAFIERGAQPDKRDFLNRNILSYATEREYTDFIRMLLEKHDLTELVNLPTGYHLMTPIMQAIEKSNEELTTLLLSYNADLTIRDVLSRTVMEQCNAYPLDQENRACDAIRQAATKNAAAPLQTYTSKEPLHQRLLWHHFELALEKRDNEMAMSIVDKNTGFLDDEYQGLYPIHWAALYGNIALLETFVALGDTLDKQGRFNENVLSLAIFAEHVDLVSILLEKYDLVRFLDRLAGISRDSLLMQAVTLNNAEITALLLPYNPDLNIQNAFGKTVIDLCNEPPIGSKNEYPTNERMKACALITSSLGERK